MLSLTKKIILLKMPLGAKRKRKYIKRSDLKAVLKYFGLPQRSLSAIVAALFIGASLAVAYEEYVGIGTWHSYNAPQGQMNVCFTPPSGCGDLIAGEIARAKHSIFVQAYGLTSQKIIYQLEQAKDRGLDVRVLVDGGNLSDNAAVYEYLLKAGISVKYDKMPGIAHNKIMILDKIKVITGSFNFTESADKRNSENVLLIEDKKLANAYLVNWHSRARLAK